MTKIAAGHIDQRLVRLWCEESGETIDWYGDRLAERGVELWHEAGGDDDGDRYIHFATGHSPRWTGSDDGAGNVLDGAKVLTDYAAGLGVEFMYNTPMVELVKENDRVVGVIAENEAGKYVQINASKGVIICTRRLLPELRHDGGATAGKSGDRGTEQFHPRCHRRWHQGVHLGGCKV